MSGYVRVGQIVAAFGIKGQVKVRPMTDFAERFNPRRRVRVNDQWLTIKKPLWHGQQLILTFEEVTTRNEAEALILQYLEALDEERPKLDKDEFLTRDLIGLQAFDQDGRALGQVDEVLAMPAHDVFKIGKLMIPAVKEFVLKIDLEGRRIDLHLIEGMEDL